MSPLENLSINLKDLTSPEVTHMIDFNDTIIQDETKPPGDRAENIIDDKTNTIKNLGMKIGCWVKLLLTNKFWF
jgi:hypothetical protein